MPMDELLSRAMPHSPEAEQAVLGSLLIDADCVKDVMDKLQPQDFYLQQNREIFETIYSMFIYSRPIDGVTVELSDEKQQRLSAKDVPEQDVVLGVRPDHIMLCADGVKGKVDVSELMGSSVHLHITAGDKDVVVIVPTNGNAAHFPMGSEVNMIFGGNVAHVFSKETEKNLEW